MFLTLITSPKKDRFCGCWFVCMFGSMLATQKLTDFDGNFGLPRQWYTEQLFKMWVRSDNAIWVCLCEGLCFEFFY